MSRYGKKDSSIATTPMGQGNIQTMLQREKPEPTQKSIQEQLAIMQQTIQMNHEEVKEKFGETKLDAEKLSQQLEEIKKQNEQHQQMIIKNEQRIQKLEKKVEESEKRVEELIQENAKLDQANQELEGAVARLEIDKANHYLRLQNLEEESEENLLETVTKMLAENLEIEPEEIRGETDEIYRLNTSYARRNKVSREVHVRFTKKAMRDEILKRTREQPLIYKGKKIDVLKQTPKRVRENRKQYHFLTNKLLNKGINYRWLTPEGILLNWNNTRYYLNSVWKASNFAEKYRTLLEGGELQDQQQERADQERLEKPKRRENRTEQDKEGQRELRNTRSTQPKQNKHDG